MPGGRVLMIAHHFPPMGGSGSNRALAFTRYLPEVGWRPTVITPGAAWALNRDDALADKLPDGLRVVRTRSWEARHISTSVVGSAPRPSRFRAQLGHLKRFPDAHIGWLPFALSEARRQPFDIAYSSSGPFTSHLVGLLLKRLTRRPWVAELRDGWYRWNRAIFPDYPVWRDKLEHRLEAVALRSADRVVLVTERMAQAFRCQYLDLPAGHFAVIPNGFDAAQFEAPLHQTTGPGWEVLHAGALYYGRSLATFLEAVNRVLERDLDFSRDFHLTLIGTLDASARAEITGGKIGQRLDIRGQLDHASTLQAMRSASALLLVANTTPGAEATVPGKLFEYLAVGRPIMAVSPEQSSTADVLAATGGGWLAAADDPEAIACVLRRAYAERSIDVNQAALAKFDRRVLAGQLGQIFDQVVAHAARGL